MKIIKITIGYIFFLGCMLMPNRASAKCGNAHIYMSHYTKDSQLKMTLYVYAGGDALKCNWSFGDGATGIGNAVFHTYANEGRYKVDVIVYDSVTNCRDTLSKYFWVINYDLKINKISTVEYELISSSTLAAPVKFLWSFLGSNYAVQFSDTGRKLKVKLPKDSIYRVCFDMIDSLGGSIFRDTFGLIITTRCGNYPYLYVSANCYGVNEVQFGLGVNSYQANVPKCYLLDFGDGTHDSLVGFYSSNAIHQYTAGGTYKVRNIFFDSGSTCRDTCFVNVVADSGSHARTKPVIKTSITNDTLRAWTVNATSIASFYWDIEGKMFSNDTLTYVLVHNKKTELRYYFKYTNGCYDEISVMVKSSNCSNAGYFTYTIDKGWNNVTVNAMVTNGSALKWDFGDGTIDGYGKSSFTHHYYTAGKVFTIKLIYGDSVNTACNDTFSDNVYLPYCDIGADFAYTIDAMRKKVYFHKTSDGKIYYWDFGDGTKRYYPQSGYDSFPYYYNGNYNVCLHTTNFDGTCMKQSCQTVHIGYLPCSAKFVKKQDTTQSFSMKIYTNSKGNRYHWDFGDGDTSNLRLPKHSYKKWGNYNLCLTIYADTCSAIYCDTVGFDSLGVMRRSQGFQLEVLEDDIVDAVQQFEHSTDQFKVYPNPSLGDKLSVFTTSKGILQLYDFNGQCIKTITFDRAGVTELDALGLSPAWYCMRFMAANGKVWNQAILIHRN